MKPLFEKDGFIICFEALPEDTSMRHHFIKECGWTEAEYRKIKGCAWFVAHVTAWKDGEMKGEDYLGACSYNTVEEFYTTHKGEYFSDMVDAALAQAKKI
jgi:hypothetical protein